MTDPTPRLVALGVAIWRDHLLLVLSTIPGDPPGWRCPGGAIELGERAADAVPREFIEEMGRRVRVLDPLPVIEDIRRYRGETGHELSFPFLVAWRDGYEPFDLDPIECIETNGTRFSAHWFPLDALRAGGFTIHPAGFMNVLDERLRRPTAPDEDVPPRAPTPIRPPLEDDAPWTGAQRVVALGHLIWRDHLLVHPAQSPGEPPAWRSLGGGVDFGEPAADAVRRELREETGREVEIVESKGVAENIFERGTVIGHEIVFEYLVRWAAGHEPESLADLDCAEVDGTAFTACWLPLDEVLDGRHVLYPDGFVDRLRDWLEPADTP